MTDLSRFFITMGIVFIAVGLLVQMAGKVPWMGRLPGDFLIRKGNFTFYFPLVTCILISVVLTFLVNLFRR